jgi:SPP1 family predicted phage head-tail adaptor
MPFGTVIQKRTTVLFAGRFRHRIDIVKVSPVQDSTGGQDINVDVIYKNVWASIEALTGKEQFAASAFISQSSHQVVIRYLTGINAGQQVWFDGRQFQIEAVLNPTEITKTLVLLVMEINNSLQQITSQPGDLD